jgi:hypothetical protein
MDDFKIELIMDLEKKLINMKNIFNKYSKDIKEVDKNKINDMLMNIIEKNEKLRMFKGEQNKKTFIGLLQIVIDFITYYKNKINYSELGILWKDINNLHKKFMNILSKDIRNTFKGIRMVNGAIKATSNPERRRKIKPIIHPSNRYILPKSPKSIQTPPISPSPKKLSVEELLRILMRPREIKENPKPIIHPSSNRSSKSSSSPKSRNSSS